MILTCRPLAYKLSPWPLPALLAIKCFLHWQVCRAEAAPNVEFRKCPNITQTGVWSRSACHRSYGATQRAQVQRKETELFGKSILPDELLAAAGDPKQRERGGRPYWLLRARSKMFKPRVPIRSKGAPTIKAQTPVIKAQWYVSTSDDANVRKYKLLPEVVHVEVRTIIQERAGWPEEEASGLDFLRGGSLSGDSTLGEDMHARIMRHNFAIYR